MKRLGIGLIGYGPYGQHLARVVLNSTRASLPLIWTRSEETAARIRSAGFDATNDVDELINHPEVEAVIVASPNAMHKEHCLKAAAAGKPLWAEKPLVLTLKDYDEILEAVEAADIVTHCNFSLRFVASSRKLIELVQAGEFGEPMHFLSRISRGTGLYSLGTAHKAVLHPELSGGWLMHHVCHQVDLALRVTSQRVKRVYCQTVKSDPECPSEESISAMLTTGQGTIIELSDSTAPQGDHYMMLLGTKAAANVTPEGHIIFRGACPENNYGHGGWSTCYTPEGYGDDAMVAFIAAVTGNPHNRPYALDLAPIRQGRHVLEVLLAMKESAATGKTVELA